MTKITTAAFVSLALVAALTACGPTAPGAGGPVTPPPTPVETVEPVVSPITAPSPELALDCDDLLSSTTLATLFTSGVAEVDPERTIIEAATLIPYKYYIEQLGGIACEWSNGQPQSDKIGTNALYKGIAISVSRVSAAEWAAFVDYYGVVDDRQVYCFDACYANLLVDGAWWVEVSLQATDAPSPLPVFTAEVAAIEAAIAGASPSGVTWAQPAGTVALSSDCEAILPASAVQSALGLGALAGWPPFGGVGLDGTARRQLDALWCNYMPSGVEASAGMLQWLPGGEWAWEEARTFALLDGPLDEIDVVGFEEGDSGWVRCSTSTCIVDLIVGHNWIQFSRLSSEVASTADERTAIEQIAAAIVATVRA